MWSVFKEIKERPRILGALFLTRMIITAVLILQYQLYYHAADNNFFKHGGYLHWYWTGYRVEFGGDITILVFSALLWFFASMVGSDEISSQKRSSGLLWIGIVVGVVVIWYGRYVASYMREVNTNEQYVHYLKLTWIKMMLMNFAITGYVTLPDKYGQTKSFKNDSGYPKKSDVLYYKKTWNQLIKTCDTEVFSSTDHTPLLTDEQVKDTLEEIGSNAGADLLLKNANIVNDKRYGKAFTRSQREAIEYGAFKGIITRMTDAELSAIVENPASTTISALVQREQHRRAESMSV